MSCSGGVICAYMRQLESTWVLVVVPLKAIDESPDSCTLTLPEGAPARWRNVMTGSDYSSQNGFELKPALGEFSVGIFVG